MSEGFSRILSTKVPHKTDHEGQYEKRPPVGRTCSSIRGHLVFTEWEKIGQIKIYSDEWTFTNAFLYDLKISDN